MTSVRVSVTIPEIDELKARWNAAPGLVERETHTAMRRSALFTEGRVKVLTPVVTGTLRRSIRSKATTMGPVVLGAVWSKVKYAAAVEDGAAPRVIVPTRKKALFWKGAKHPVRKVNWPGFPGRHMFKRGMDSAKHVVQGHFEDALQKVADIMERG